MHSNMIKAFRFAACCLVLIAVFGTLDSFRLIRDRKNAADVLVSIKGITDSEARDVRVSGVTASGREIILNRVYAVWLNDNAYLKRIKIYFANGAFENASGVQVRVGGRLFSYASQGIVQEWTGYCNKDDRAMVVESPHGLGLPRSSIPLARLQHSINWDGDRDLLLLVLGDLYKVFLAFIVIASVYCLLRRYYREEHKLAFSAFAITLLVASIFALIGVDPHHDGIMFKPALDVVQGRVLFKDTFSMYGPASILLQALAIKIAGQYLVVIRLLTALFYALLSLFLYMIWRRFMPRWLAFFSCMVWLLMSHFFIKDPSIILFPWSTVYATFTVVLSLYLLFLYLDRGRVVYWLAIGTAAAMTFLFKQDYGATNIAGAFFTIPAIALVRKVSKKNAAAMIFMFLAGLITVFSILAGWLYLSGALKAYWLQNIKYPMVFAGKNFENTTHTPMVVELLKCMLLIGMPDHFATYIWILLPAATVFLFLRSSVKFVENGRLDRNEEYILAASIIALFNWVNYYPIPAVFQYQMSATPMVGLLSYLGYDISSRIEKSAMMRHAALSALMDDLKKLVSYVSFNRIDHKKISTGLIVFIILMGVAYRKDVTFRLKDALRKIEKDHYRIDSVPVLSGMVSNRNEKNFYGEIKKEILAYSFKYPKGDIVSLTGSALFTTFKKGSNNFSPMYMYWTWVNNLIDPGYMGKLRCEISTNKDLIFSQYFMLDNYVPWRSYILPRSFEEPFALMVPGTKENIFTVHTIEKQKMALVSSTTKADTENSPSKFFTSSVFLFEVRLKSPGEAMINSIIVYMDNDRLIPKRLNKFEFENGILPNILSSADRAFMKMAYAKNGSRRYDLSQSLNEADMDRLKSIFINFFLDDEYVDEWDTIAHSKGGPLLVLVNGETAGNNVKKEDLGVRLKTGDVMDIVVPHVENLRDGRDLIKLRINYDSGKYAEYLLWAGYGKELMGKKAGAAGIPRQRKGRPLSEIMPANCFHASTKAGA